MMHSKKILLSVSLIGLLVSSCGSINSQISGGESGSLNQGSGNGNLPSIPSGPAPAPGPVATGNAQFLLSTDLSNIDINLADAQDFTLTVSPTSELSSELQVNLSADLSDLAGLNPGNTVRVEFNPSTVLLSPGQNKVVAVSVSSDVAAPRFDARSLRLVGASSDNTQVSDMTRPFKIAGVYEVFILDDTNANHMWGHDRSQDIVFRVQPGSVMLKINNMAAGSHRVHGNNRLIPHQSGQTAPGASYDVTINTSAPSSQNGLFYCHDHEVSNLGTRVLVAN